MNQSAKELLQSELMKLTEDEASELFRNFMKMKLGDERQSAEAINDDENWEKYNDENDWEQHEECCVCFEETSQKTSCNHFVCNNCVVKLKKCPLCREKLIMPKINYDEADERRIKGMLLIGTLRAEIKILKKQFKDTFGNVNKILRLIQLCEERIREIQVERGR
jgi:hypothetical protein